MVLIIVGSTSSVSPTGLYELNKSNALVFLKILDSSGTEDSTNASWMVDSSSETRSQKFIFSTNETRGSIQMHSLVRSGNDVSVKLCSSIPSGGSGTTHLALYEGAGDEAAALIASNYDSGSVTIFSVNLLSGSITGPIQTIDQNQVAAQTPAHAHQCVIHGNMAYVCDLGNDSVYTYSLSSTEISLSGECKLPLGCGPRHLVVNAAGTWAYVLCELSSEVAAVRIDPSTSILTSMDDGETNSSVLFNMLPVGASSDDMAGAAILLSGDGRFLYVSNRDKSPSTAADPSKDRSSISVFAISVTGDSLRLIQTTSSRGRHPRHMALLDTAHGRALLVANRDSQNFAVFPVDEASGLLVEQDVVVSLADLQCRDPGFVIEI